MVGMFFFTNFAAELHSWGLEVMSESLSAAKKRKE